MSKVDEVSQMLDEIFDEKDAMEEMKQQFFDALLEDHRYMRSFLKKELGVGRYNIELLPNLNVKGAPEDE